MATGDQHLCEATSLNLKKQAGYTILPCLNNLTDIVLKSQTAEQKMLEVKYQLKISCLRYTFVILLHAHG